MNIPRAIDALFMQYPTLKNIVTRIHERGGHVLLVGGAVRDIALDIPVKDLDIEIHGMALQDLEKILQEFGPVSMVGKLFGVLRVHSLDIDWSLPRTDTSGRKPNVTLNPTMSYEQAFRRRDITMNAMGIDLVTHELIDPFNGMAAIQQKILRTPDPEFFVQDPLRFFRVMQFIGRFNMQPDEELNNICTHMNLQSISRERIEQELAKLFLKSQQPSLGIRWINSISRLEELFPELAATKNVPQNPEWHPEGDVFEHTMQALDAAARIECATEQEKLILMYAALCHDLGKATTTQTVDGVIQSHGHDVEGVPLAKALLKRITNNIDLLKTVPLLVHYHMAPLQFIQGSAKAPAYKRLALKLAPYTTINMLGKLAMADKLGRNPQRGRPLPATHTIPGLQQFLDKAAQAQVLHAIEKPILHGADFMPEFQPGPELGKILKIAYELQIEEGIKDKDILLKKAHESYTRLKKS